MCTVEAFLAHDNGLLVPGEFLEYFWIEAGCLYGLNGGSFGALPQPFGTALEIEETADGEEFV